MHRNFLIVFFWFVLYANFAQTENKFQGQMFSADVNMGYNLARIETNYLFEEKMPYSFQLNWHHSNYEKQKTFNLFGYSDFGATFLYHDFRDEELGKNFGFYAFIEYYLWNPKHKLQLSFRFSQGIAYNTNPYDRTYNSKNKLFGSHLLLPFDIALYLKYPKIYKHWGLQMGLAIFHYSNANLQSPNYGANIPSLSLGINYDFRKYLPESNKELPEFNKKWRYSIFLRFGFNESDYYDSGIFPFFVPGFQMEKRLSFRHKIYLGTELYLSYFLREQIRYEYYSFPEVNHSEIKDFKRWGIYAGHEFFYNKLGISFELGYYVYYPYKFETRYYNRLSINLYVLKRLKTSVSLKFHHFSRAEAMELGVMYRF